MVLVLDEERRVAGDIKKVGLLHEVSKVVKHLYTNVYQKLDSIISRKS